MDSILTHLFNFLSSFESTPLLLEIAIKSMALLVSAYLAANLMKNFSASTRHFIWAITLLCIVLLPLLSFTISDLQIFSNRILFPNVVVTTESVTLGDAIKVTSENITKQNQIQKSNNRPKPDQNSDKPLGYGPNISTIRDYSGLLETSLFSLAIIAWLCGFFYMTIRLSIDIFCVMYKMRDNQEITSGHWYRLMRNISEKYNIDRNVRMFSSSNFVSPISTGLFRPKIVVPNNFSNWSEAKIRTVLLHELAHIKRWDILTHYVGKIVKILHWYNPMLRMALTKLDNDCEKACDDLVIISGTSVKEYANHLIEIAGLTKKPEPGFVHFAGISRGSNLGTRVVSLLDSDLDRKSINRTNASIFILTALLSLTFLAAIQPVTLKKKSPWDKSSAYMFDENWVSSDQFMDKIKKQNDSYEMFPISEEKDRELPTISYEFNNLINEHYALKSELQSIKMPSKLEVEAYYALVKSLNDPDNEVRIQTVRLIDQARLKDSTTLLQQRLYDQNSTVRLLAVSALRKFNTHESIQTLMDNYYDVESDTRIAILKSLALFNNDGAKRIIKSELNNSDNQFRLIASLALIMNRDFVDNESTASVKANLSSDNISLRIASIAALLPSNFEIASRSLEQELQNTVLPMERKTLILLALANSGIEVRTNLTKMIYSNYKNIQEAAARTLGIFYVNGSGEMLMSILDHPNINVRKGALLDLGNLYSNSNTISVDQHLQEDVINTLLSHTESYEVSIRQNAIFALGKIGTNSALNRLMELAINGEHEVRLASLWSLGKIGAKESKKTILLALNDENSKIRSFAAQALGELTKKSNSN